MVKLSEKPRTVLVTGAAGFIGSHIALRAQSDWQAHVTGIDCFTHLYDERIKRNNAELLAKHGIEVLEVDLARGDLSELPDVEVIYHAAAEPGISSDSSLDDYLRNNVRATDELVRWAKRIPTLELLVFLSTSSVYGINATVDEQAPPQPASNYGVTKLAAEQLCLAAQRQGVLPACSCRLFSVYGPRERPEKLIPKLLQAAFDNQPMQLFEGSEQHRRSFTFINDIVDGLLAVGRRRSVVSGRIYNLGSPATYSTAQVIQSVEAALEQSIPIEYVPPRPGDQLSTEAVIDAARNDLDYSPSTSLDAGIRRTISSFASQYQESAHR